MFIEFRKIMAVLPNRLRIKLLFLAVLMLLGAFAEVVSLSAIVPFLTLLVDNDSVAKLNFVGDWLASKPLSEQKFWISGAFLGALVMATMMKVILLSTNIRFTQAAGFALSKDAFRKTLSQPYDWHTQHNSSEHIANLGRVSAFVNSNIGPMLNLLTASIMGGAILSLLLMTHTLIMLGLLIGITTFYALVIKLTRQGLLINGKIINRAASERVRVVQESLGGIRDVILDNSFVVHLKRFERVEMAQRSAMKHNQWVSQLPRHLLELIGMTGIVFIAMYITTVDQDASISTLGFIAFGSQKLMPLAQQIYYAWSTLRSAGPSRKDVFNLIALPDCPPTIDTQSIAFNSTINLSKVFYAYPGHNKQALHSIDLKINRGQRIGFVGPSGGGKSTLIDLIMGLLIPSSGQISIDGTVLSSDNISHWRKRVAHVPQSIYLLDASIRENIAFGVEPSEIDESRVLRCISMAQLTETINSLPAGLDTVIGERGVMLSGGQRQRIGIARALYRQADVLVLDEATSALDNDTEQRVIAALQEIGAGVTVLMVAHRLTTLAQCDRIVHIENGSITRQESYEELMTPAGSQHQAMAAR